MKTFDPLGTPTPKKCIVGAGFIALDVLVSLSRRQAPLLVSAGGTCGNVLIASSLMGEPCEAVGMLGLDYAGDLVVRDLRLWGVGTTGLERSDRRQTPIVQQWNDGLEHSFASQCLSCERTLPDFDARGEMIFCSQSKLAEASVFFFDRASRDNVAMAYRARAAGAVVVFEPNSIEGMSDALPVTHILKYSGARLRDLELTGDQRPIAEIVTDGARGLRMRSQQQDGGYSDWFHLPAVEPTALVDSCGAGDWCTSALISAIHRAMATRRRVSRELCLAALRRGQNFAAWNCAFAGARGGMYLEAGLAPSVVPATSPQTACPLCFASTKGAFN